MAKELHSDAIAFEIEPSKDVTPPKVEFLHFEGVAPRQFHNMFRATSRKDASGKFIPIQVQRAEKVIPEYLDNYQDFESKAVEHFDKQIAELSSHNSVDKGLPVGDDKLQIINQTIKKGE